MLKSAKQHSKICSSFTLVLLLLVFFSLFLLLLYTFETSILLSHNNITNLAIFTNGNNNKLNNNNNSNQLSIEKRLTNLETKVNKIGKALTSLIRTSNSLYYSYSESSNNNSKIYKSMLYNDIIPPIEIYNNEIGKLSLSTYNPYPSIAINMYSNKSLLAFRISYKSVTNKCKHNYRVFGIGMFKTGTTSLSKAMSILGYRCYWRTCKFLAPWEYINNVNYDIYLYGSDNIDWIFNNSNLYNDIKLWSSKSGFASDGPWLFLYSILDQWYPGSKFILTVRNSTWNILNSDLKMELRSRLTIRNEKYAARNAVIKSLDEKTTYGPNVLEFLMLCARRYQIHNFKVKNYFKYRKEDLLILNIDGVESGLYKSLWDPIIKFLGCEKPSVNYPITNVSPEDQTNSLDKKMKFNWRKFDFSPKYKTIFDKSEKLDSVLYNFIYHYNPTIHNLENTFY